MIVVIIKSIHLDNPWRHLPVFETTVQSTISDFNCICGAYCLHLFSHAVINYTNFVTPCFQILGFGQLMVCTPHTCKTDPWWLEDSVVEASLYFIGVKKHLTSNVEVCRGWVASSSTVDCHTLVLALVWLFTVLDLESTCRGGGYKSSNLDYTGETNTQKEAKLRFWFQHKLSLLFCFKTVWKNFWFVYLWRTNHILNCVMACPFPRSPCVAS